MATRVIKPGDLEAEIAARLRQAQTRPRSRGASGGGPRFPTVRRTFAVASSLVLVLGAMVGTSLASHGEAGAPTDILNVQPVRLHGNNNCPVGTAEIRVQAPATGTFSSGAFSVRMTVITDNTRGGQYFNFEALSGTVLDVFVKAGPDTNFYEYGAGAVQDEFLHGPVNSTNPVRFFGLSHISFCMGSAPPDVSVQKTPDGESSAPGTIEAGDTATFTMTVTSNGPGTALNVTLDDNLPSGFTWTESSDPSNACEVGALDADAFADLKCSFGDLAAGQIRTVSVSAPTSSGTCGTINNTATIAATVDSNASNNSNPGSIIVLCPNVKVEKTGNGPINGGQTATFLITVTNEGPGAASDVSLTDSLPDSGLTWTETTDPSNACTLGGVAGAQTLSCSFGTLAEGATRTVSLSSPTDTSDCGTISNTVNITATGDITAADNQSTGTITVQCGALKITKTAKHADDEIGTPDLSGTFTVTDAAGNERFLETNASGVGCIDGLAIGTASIVEDPLDFPGYAVADIDPVNVVAGSCSGTTLTGGTNVPVENAPLTDISWSVDSLVNGGTSTVVTCRDTAGDIIDGYPITIDGDGDDSGTLEDILPTAPTVVTVTCTFEVDP